MSVSITIDSTGEAFAFDGYASISFSPRVAVTSHPVEDGSPSTDHARREPDVFTVNGALATPVQRRTARPLIVDEAKAFLERCVGELLTVDTVRDGRKRNCLIEGWANTQDTRLGRRFDLSFRQVIIASPTTVLIPASQPDTARAGSGMPDEVDGGKQATEDVGAQKTEELQSKAALFVDFATGGT